jgi:hypothetical protein
MATNNLGNHNKALFSNAAITNSYGLGPASATGSIARTANLFAR